MSPTKSKCWYSNNSLYFLYIFKMRCSIKCQFKVHMKYLSIFTLSFGNLENKSLGISNCSKNCRTKCSKIQRKEYKTRRITLKSSLTRSLFLQARKTKRGVFKICSKICRTQCSKIQLCPKIGRRKTAVDSERKSSDRKIFIKLFFLSLLQFRQKQATVFVTFWRYAES